MRPHPKPLAALNIYNNLGTTYQSLNDLDKAEEYYDLALSQAVYGNDVGMAKPECMEILAMF